MPKLPKIAEIGGGFFDSSLGHERRPKLQQATQRES
jgi:hypothetical protein